jgi:hypothetical protein
MIKGECPQLIPLTTGSPNVHLTLMSCTRGGVLSLTMVANSATIELWR